MNHAGIMIIPIVPRDKKRAAALFLCAADPFLLVRLKS